MGASLSETRRGEQIEDLFVLVDSIVGSMGVELAEGVPSGELDNLVPLISNVLACYGWFIIVFFDIVFIWMIGTRASKMTPRSTASCAIPVAAALSVRLVCWLNCFHTYEIDCWLGALSKSSVFRSDGRSSRPSATSLWARS